MTETRDITLAGRTFAVPALPLRVNRVVYPICRDLTKADIIGKVIEAGGGIDVLTDQEIDDLAKISLLAAKAADPELTEEAFEDMPIAPQQLLDAFFVIRYQTGAWVPGTASTGSDEADAEGEAQGA